MPTYNLNTISTTQHIENVADSAGSYFFTPNTMKAFNSRILSGVRALDGKETKEGNRFLFVTSERYDAQPRHYALRMMTLGSIRDDRPYVDIVTVGDGNYATAAQARAAMRDHVS